MAWVDWMVRECLHCVARVVGVAWVDWMVRECLHASCGMSGGSGMG